MELTQNDSHPAQPARHTVEEVQLNVVRSNGAVFKTWPSPQKALLLNQVFLSFLVKYTINYSCKVKKKGSHHKSQVAYSFTVLVEKMSRCWSCHPLKNMNSFLGCLSSRMPLLNEAAFYYHRDLYCQTE